MLELLGLRQDRRHVIDTGREYLDGKKLLPLRRLRHLLQRVLAHGPVKRLVDGGRSGYSSLSVGRHGTPSEGWIYLHYEHDPFKGSHMARFNLSWLLEGELTGDGDLPKLKRGN